MELRENTLKPYRLFSVPQTGLAVRFLRNLTKSHFKYSCGKISWWKDILVYIRVYIYIIYTHTHTPTALSICEFVGLYSSLASFLNHSSSLLKQNHRHATVRTKNPLRATTVPFGGVALQRHTFPVANSMKITSTNKRKTKALNL